MNIRELLQSAAQRFARRMAFRVALGGAAVIGAGVRAYTSGDAGAPAEPPAAPVPALAAAPTRTATVALAAPGVDAARPADSAAAPATAAPAADSTAPVAAAPTATPVPAGESPVGMASSGAADSSTAAALAAMGREAYTYAGQARRDPFASLLKPGGELRPLFTDLRLVTVLVGSDGRNSVAIMRDLATQEQYRRRSGESLGRMRVARIDPRQVVFTIEEFGYSRQEVLTYSDSTTMRTR